VFGLTLNDEWLDSHVIEWWDETAQVPND
jgi:hypothetical protein